MSGGFLKLTAAAGLSAAGLALAGCGGGGGSDTVVNPPTPTPPTAPVGIGTLGASFGNGFRASNNAEPLEPSTMSDFTSPSLTTDPFEPTGA